jgi:enamine deaminase RidA (YjgF/YER057c/UK114 family)
MRLADGEVRMAGRIEARLAELGIAIPATAPPLASYVPSVQTGNLLFVSGQITLKDGKPDYIGKLGRDFTAEQGYQAARLCALNIVAQLQAALGELDRVRRIVKLTGFVNAVPDFTDQPQVVNGASDLLAEIFGEQGRHARSAVGVGSLPRGVACEIEAIVEIT